MGTPRSLWIMLAAALLALGLAACGEQTWPPDEAPADSDTSSTPPTSVPTTPDSGGSVTTGPTDTFKKVRVSGTVTLREGCVDLTDANGVIWTLSGEKAATLSEGQRVSVTGRSRPESSDCAGVPLVIAKLTPLV